MSFLVIIELDGESLEKIYQADQRVVVVRDIYSGITSSSTYPQKESSNSTRVIWAVMEPLLMYNQLSWDSTYFFFATTNTQQTGGKLIINSYTVNTLDIAEIYTFSMGQFLPGGANNSGQYALYNKMQGSFSFGLAQAPVINDQTMAMAALDARAILFNQMGYFQPANALWLFLDSPILAGTFISTIPDTALYLELDNQNSTVVVGFNNGNNTFYLKYS